MTQTHRRKYKGQADKTALALFGSTKRMETAADRETMALVLAQSASPVMRELARQAMDPIHKHTSFAKLAENNALNIHMLSEEVKSIYRAQGIMKAASKLPKMIEQAADDAMSREEKCKGCKGADCIKCGGTGIVYRLGDIDRLKMMFETFGLTSKGGGVSVNLDFSKHQEKELSHAELSAALGPILEGNSQ
jgi:hypothetical protein